MRCHKGHLLRYYEERGAAHSGQTVFPAGQRGSSTCRELLIVNVVGMPSGSVSHVLASVHGEASVRLFSSG